MNEQPAVPASVSTLKPPAPVDPVRFDILGPLPTGTTVLEASAGTGKTFTIAALATRYVAEGVADLSELLLVTFGRAATSELRDRVRERMVSAEAALRSSDARDSEDDLVRHLVAGVNAGEQRVRRERLTRALADFDAATIATTHGFCQRMLSSLGVSADTDTDAVFVPDVADLLDEVVDDLYLRRYANESTPVLSEADARAVAGAAVRNPSVVLQPDDADPASRPGHLVRFARDVASEVVRRKRRQHLLDYDDLLILLYDALTDPESGAAAAARVRDPFAVVLVDEFQDTDPVQWQILRTAFHGHRTLVLIGDPKQAIYGFRGGDVAAYLSARGDATTTATLSQCWRSDRPLLAGLDRLFAEVALGDPQIVVRPLAARHIERRLDGLAPVRLRQVTRAALGTGPSRNPSVEQVRALIATDVAADVVRQLDHSRIRADEDWRAVEPPDIAVLTYRNADAARVRDALADAGVPAVISSPISVFATPAARDWAVLLAALEQPGHGGRTARAAFTPFVGWEATRLATASDAERDQLADRVRQWATVLNVHGVAALVEALTAHGLAERLLRESSGERVLTDLQHIGQILHVAQVREGLGTAALADWLSRRVAEAGGDYAQEQTRRLETDAAAVQVVTIHASKGLEFPIVYVPFGWDRFEGRRPPAVLRFHDTDGRRVMDVGGPESGEHARSYERHLAEERGEDLRLLYVALTRARSQVVAWWSPSSNSGSGALSRLLLGGHEVGGLPPGSVAVPDDATVTAALSRLVSGPDSPVVVEQVDEPPEPPRWSPTRTAAPALTVRAWNGRVDLLWRRTSYTGLTAGLHQDAHGPGAIDPAAAAQPGAEMEGVGTQDEMDVGVLGELTDLGREATGGGAAPGPGRAGHRVPPLADLPGGTAFGTLVHTVLEHTDLAAADLDDEVLRRCREAGAVRLPGVVPDDLAAGLVPVLRTPLGPLAGGVSLADVATGDRLAELDFELPLAGGDTPTSAGSTLDGVIALLRAHLGPDDVFAPYADHLAAAGIGASTLRGYLTGSLDAVLRLRDDRGGGEPRYLVVDYKTNRLAPADETLTTWHYRPSAMAQAMMLAHYPLQLLLYSAALHRFLRWRQPGYDPARHLGGGLYLFVRGMCGPDTPMVDGVPCGVMAWRPPDALVTDLSDLLDGTSEVSR